MSDNRNYQVLVKLATWQEPRAMKMTFSPKVGVLWWAIFVSSYAVVSVRCCMHQRRWVFEPEVRYSEVRGIHLYLCICVFVLYLCTGICICQHRWRWACEPEGRCLGVRHIHLKCHSLLQLQAHLCSPYAPPPPHSQHFRPHPSIRLHQDPSLLGHPILWLTSSYDSTSCYTLIPKAENTQSTTQITNIFCHLPLKYHQNQLSWK